MSLEEELKKKLNSEREKVRLNTIKMLEMLGYKSDTSKLNQEQLDARVEILLDQNKNNDIDPEIPQIFQGIDEERENIDAVENGSSLEEILDDYDALEAHIPQIRSNSRVGYMVGLTGRKNIRIIRLPASIKISDSESVLRRVVL